MPLPSQKIEFPLGLGLNQKLQAELLDPSQAFITAQNVMHTQTGSLCKPYGLTLWDPGTYNGDVVMPQLGGTGSIGIGTVATSRRVFGYKDEACIICFPALSGVLYGSVQNVVATYSSTEKQWCARGYAPECIVSSRLVVGTQQVFDQCLVNGYLAIVLASVGSAGLSVVILDTVNNAVVPQFNIPTLVGNTAVRLVAIGKVLICQSIESGNTIKQQWLDTTSPGTISNGWQTVANDIAASVASFDSVGAASGVGFVGYIDTSGGAHILSFNASGTVTGPESVLTGTFTTGVGVALASGVVWLAAVASGGGGAVHLAGFNPSGALSSPSFTEQTVISPAGSENLLAVSLYAMSGDYVMVVAGNDSTGVQTMYWCLARGSAGATSFVAGSKCFRAVPLTRPFQVGTRIYCMASYQSSTAVNSQASSYIVDLGLADYVTTSFVPGWTRSACTISPRLSVPPGNTLSQTNMPLSAPVSGTLAYVANTLIESDVIQGVESITLDFANTACNAAAKHIDIMGISGGVPSFYDGSQVAEMGFLVAPEVKSVTGGSSGSVLPAGGSWDYVAIYEHADARGQLHRSAPSEPFNFSSGGSGYASAAVVVTGLALTMRGLNFAPPAQSQVVIALYRTINGGATWYRVGTALTPNGTSTVSITDALTDASLSSNELLYTQPGTLGTALERVNPPSFTWMIEHNDLLWGITGDDCWYTGQAVEGEGPWWSDEFQFPVLGGSGPLTAMGSMDGNLLLFKRDAVFLVSGTGAADNGTGSDIQAPQRIPVDIGCIEPRSVVTTAMGIMFQSERGLELLNRGLQVEDSFGRNVFSLVGFQGGIVTSAVLDRAQSRVIFTVRNTESGPSSSGSQVVLFDLIHKTWSTKSVAGFASYGLKSATVLQSSPGLTSRYAILQDNAQVSYENVATHLDSVDGTPGDFAPSTLETGWIKLAGLQGFQRLRRVYVLGTSVEPHDLSVSFAFDYNATYTQTQTWTAAEIASFANAPGPWQASVMVGHQKCSAIRIKIQDATPTGESVGTGSGVTLLSLGLEYAVYDKMARIPPAQRQ